MKRPHRLRLIEPPEPFAASGVPPLNARGTLWFIRDLVWLRLKRKLRLVKDADIRAENERLRTEIARLHAEAEPNRHPVVECDE